MSYEAKLQRKFIKEFKLKYPDIVVSHSLSGVNLGADGRRGRMLKLMQTHEYYLDLTFHRKNEVYPLLILELKISRKHYEKFNSERLRGQRVMAVKMRSEGYYTDFVGIEDGEVWQVINWFYNPDFAKLYKSKKFPYWEKSILKGEGFDS